MMFEELFSRRKQSKTTARSLPRDVDAIQKVGKSGIKNHHSSMTVDSYIWITRLVVGVILLIGLGTIGSQAYGLISDFITYSGGEQAVVDEQEAQTPVE